MNAFVTKPVDPDALYASLLHWLTPAGVEQAVAPGQEPLTPGAAGWAAAEWRQRWARVPGLDIESGLAHLPGGPQTWTRVLDLFASRHAHDAQGLADGLAAGDLEALASLAHDLKGSAGNIGAQAVAAAAGALNSALREDRALDDVERCTGVLVAELVPLLAGIAGGLGEAPPSA